VIFLMQGDSLLLADALLMQTHHRRKILSPAAASHLAGWLAAFVNIGQARTD